MTKKPKPDESFDGIDALVNAFHNFNATATTLTETYRKLELRIAHLTNEIEAKDRELYQRFRELDQKSRVISSLLETISSGVIAIDLEGTITMFNRMACELTGLNSDDAIGRNYLDVMGEENSDLSPIHALKHGPEIKGIEKVLLQTGIRVETSTTWVVDSFGNKTGLIEIFDDVSTLRRLEEKIEYHKTLSALGEMAAAIAHELRNPLAGISGFAAILKEELTDRPDLLELDNRIIQGVKDLDRLAGNLLFLTRKTVVNRTDVMIDELLSDVFEILKAEVKDSSFNIDIDLILPLEIIPISSDKEMLKSIFTNLGRNAIQSIKQNGTVSIRVVWKLLANKVVISVEDNGCGIPEENLQRLFNPFFTTRAEGTGLGLALVKKSVDFLKGQIQVESRAGKGTVFSVTLPIKLHMADSSQPAY